MFPGKHEKSTEAQKRNTCRQEQRGQRVVIKRPEMAVITIIVDVIVIIVEKKLLFTCLCKYIK